MFERGWLDFFADLQRDGAVHCAERGRLMAAGAKCACVAWAIQTRHSHSALSTRHVAHGGKETGESDMIMRAGRNAVAEDSECAVARSPRGQQQ